MNYGQSGEDAGRAVIVPAMRHAVDMRADDPPRQLRLRALHRQIEVAGRVDPLGKIEITRSPPNKGMGELLALAVGGAGDTRLVRGVAPQFLEEALRKRDGRFHFAPSARRSAVIAIQASALTRWVGRSPASAIAT